LAACYRNSLAIAAARGFATVAFPCISTGIFGYPAEAAARVAVDAVRAHALAAQAPHDVAFCCFGETDLAIYLALLGERD